MSPLRKIYQNTVFGNPYFPISRQDRGFCSSTRKYELEKPYSGIFYTVFILQISSLNYKLSNTMLMVCQTAFTYSKLAIETREQSVKYVQSQQ